MAESLTGRPTIVGNMLQTSQYRTMGFGTTSRVLLIGHADGLSINDPYQVNNIREAINVLQADTDSPLLRGLLEAYNGGCRDVWIMAAAPMSEYEPVIDDRLLTQFGGLTFYQKYYQRLAVSYDLLKAFDFAEIITPLEAPFYYTGGVDFMTQLINHCEAAFTTSNTVHLGVIGTRIPSTIAHNTAVSAMVADARLTSLPSAGKYVMVVVGEGLVNFRQLNFSYKCSVSTQVAINMATIDFSRGMSYSKLGNIINLDGANYTTTQLNSLVEKKLNPAIRTTKSNRGRPFQTVLLTDNTLGSTGSDYWSMTQMRIIAKIANSVRSIGYSYIGSIDYPGFKQAVMDYLSDMVRSNIIKSFDLRIERLEEDDNKVGVEIGITPYFGLRNLYFSVKVGPGS